MKKFLRNILTLVIFTTTAIQASAYYSDFEVDGIYYIILQDGKSVEVTYTPLDKDDYSGDIIIPNKVYNGGNTYEVTSIGREAFEGCSSLISIVIPNSVTEILSSAFDGCSGLTSVEIPNSVTEIGSVAFAGCSSLISIEIPNSLTSVGEGAFRRCSSLKSVYPQIRKRILLSQKFIQ